MKLAVAMLALCAALIGATGARANNHDLKVGLNVGLGLDGTTVTGTVEDALTASADQRLRVNHRAALGFTLDYDGLSEGQLTPKLIQNPFLELGLRARVSPLDDPRWILNVDPVLRIPVAGPERPGLDVDETQLLLRVQPGDRTFLRIFRFSAFYNFRDQGAGGAVNVDLFSLLFIANVDIGLGGDCSDSSAGGGLLDCRFDELVAQIDSSVVPVPLPATLPFALAAVASVAALRLRRRS